MEKIRISVIVTSYNYEQYIRRTLDSLVNQTYKEFEVIITDDGSKDNSLNIIKEYTEKYPNFYLFTHENNENRGLLESTKLALSKAKYEYIAFLESDDYWTEDYLQEKVNFINTNPDSVLVINDVQIEGEHSLEGYLNGVAKFFRTNTNKNKYFELLYESNNLIATFSIVMIRADILKSLNFDSPVAPWLDLWLWRQVVIQYPVDFIDKKLTIWNRHDASYIKQNEEENNKKRKSFIKHSNNLLIKRYSLLKFLNKFAPIKIKLILQNIFSIQNENIDNKKHKVLTLFGYRIRIK